MAKKRIALVGAVLCVLAIALPARAADTSTTFSLAGGLCRSVRRRLATSALVRPEEGPFRHNSAR